MLRLFNDLMGGQASWLLPAALLVVVAGLAWRLRAPRTDRTRAAIMLWGSWLVVSGLVFSLSAGVIHTYYTVALAPAIAALVAIGAAVAWRSRERVAARALLALGVIVTAVWAIVLLGRTPSWEPWLVPVIAVASGVAAVGLLMPARVMRRLSAATAVIALVACLAGPVAYSAQTIGSAHTGSVPSAGPSSGAGGGLGGGGHTRGAAGGFPGAVARGCAPWHGGCSGHGTFPGVGEGLSRSGGPSGSAGTSGGPGNDSASSALVAALKSGASGYRWAAATSGSQSAASLELATGGVPVMAIGGFSGQGGNLSLAQFEAYVKAGDIHYYIASGGGGGGGGGGGFGGGGFGGGAGGPGGGSSTSSITSWVKAHYRAETIGGQTVYDLTQPLQS